MIPDDSALLDSARRCLAYLNRAWPHMEQMRIGYAKMAEILEAGLALPAGLEDTVYFHSQTASDIFAEWGKENTSHQLPQEPR